MSELKTRNAISVTVRWLSHALGPPYSTARISTSDRLSRIERVWMCGCQANSETTRNVAYWFPCSQHEITFAGEGGKNDVRRAAERLNSLVVSRIGPHWRAPALAFGVALVAKSAFDSLYLLKRAEEAEAASLVDPLTGLYNRRGWNRRIIEERKRLKRDGQAVVGVYVLDVDGLKKTNDERGHSAGDNLLREVARVIREVTREHDVAARLGGDEFGIMTVQKEFVETNLVRARLERSFSAASLAVSIGFAYADSVDTIEEAMERADGAMYDVKRTNAQAVSRR